ncbi:lactonase family protein [Lutibacter sp.]
MKNLILLTTFISLLSCNNETSLYVGTYTNKSSEGIYKLSFNEKTGEISNLTLVAKANNPSFLIFDSKKKYVYAVHENNKFNNEISGSISAYKVEDSGVLSLINTVSSKGAHPCYIAIDASDKNIVVTNYSGGTVALFQTLENGGLKDAFQVFNHNLDNVLSHAHSAQFVNNSLLVSDLGRNAVFEYTKNNGSYSLKSSSIVAMAKKSGPRHFVLDASKEFIYVINEHSNSITIAKRNGKDFELIGHTSTLDNSFKGKSYCADIHISNNQKFIYGSNRGENSIVVFKRNVETGSLEKIQTISTEGDWPRNFTLSPNGKHLLVANQKSNTISVYKINSESGKLRYLHNFKINAPVCLLF